MCYVCATDRDIRNIRKYLKKKGIKLDYYGVKISLLTLFLDLKNIIFVGA